MQEHDNLVGGLEEAHRCPAELLPDLAHLSVEAPDALVAAVGLGVHGPGGHVELEVGVTEGDQGGDVPAVQMAMRQADDLDVLVGHLLAVSRVP